MPAPARLNTPLQRSERPRVCGLPSDGDGKKSWRCSLRAAGEVRAGGRFAGLVAIHVICVTGSKRHAISGDSLATQEQVIGARGWAVFVGGNHFVARGAAATSHIRCRFAAELLGAQNPYRAGRLSDTTG